MAGRWRTLRKMWAKTNHFKPGLDMAVAPLARGLTAASAQFRHCPLRRLSECFCTRAKPRRGKGVPEAVLCALRAPTTLCGFRC